MGFVSLGSEGRQRQETHVTTLGAMTLQGPHQVAKQSSTTSVSLSASALSQSGFAERLWAPIFLAEEWKAERSAGWRIVCWRASLGADCLDAIDAVVRKMDMWLWLEDGRSLYRSWAH